MRSMHRSLAAIVLGLGLFALPGVFPFAANAQRTPTPYRVGVLNDARGANHPAVDGLKAGLRDLGFEEARDVIFDVRLTEGDPERITAAAAALVKAGVDVIFTSGEAATLAARAATPAIPIVFTLVGDPVAAGVVKSLAPQVRRAWAIQHAADPASGAVLARALAFASRFGMEIVPRIVRTPAD